MDTTRPYSRSHAKLNTRGSLHEQKQVASAATELIASVASLPDPQPDQSLRDYLEVVALQMHRAANPATPLTADDYAVAELEALRRAQRDYFLAEMAKLTAGTTEASSSCLITLAPELDKVTRLVRVGGRRNVNLTSDAVHPVLLDPKHPLTRMMIQDCDTKLHYPGPERVFAEVRRRYWILRGREAVRRHQRRYTKCRRWRGRPETSQMADLPPARQRSFQPAFYCTGVDSFGPYSIRIRNSTEKSWWWWGAGS